MKKRSPFHSRKLLIKRRSNRLWSMQFKNTFWLRSALKWVVALGVTSFVILCMYGIIALGPLRGFLFDIPRLAGFFGTQKYLILFQNNYELRPTGGFISAYAELNMTFGIPSLSVHDSYEIDYLPFRNAPKPLETFFTLDDKYRGWQFRDANFNPDFATSVEQVLTFYNEKYPEASFDGVVAINFSFLEQLLASVGSIKIHDTTLHSDNLFLETQLAVKNIDLHSEEDLKNRKGILKPLAQTLIRTVIFSPSLWNDVSEAAYIALQQKNILLYFSDKDMQELVKNNNWSAEFNGQHYQNFVYIDSINIGGRKADRYVNKYYQYKLQHFEDEPPIAEIDIQFEHDGTYNLQSDLYQGYVRAHLPLGVQVQEVSGDFWRGLNNEFTFDLSEENNAQVVGFYVHFFPGDQRNIKLRYELPDISKAHKLDLDVIKQPGTGNDLWSIIQVLPSESSAKNTSKDVMTIKDNVLSWKGVLKQDLNFRIERVHDVYPPIVTAQKFRDLEHIEITFDEDLVVKENQAPNFIIEDLNHINSESDSIAVLSYEIVEKILVLKVSGVTAAEEERYRIQLTNIYDKAGNSTEPNPRELTVVQRLSEN